MKFTKIFLFLPFLLFLNNTISFSHEPVFGLGPGTIYKGGIGLGLEYEKEDNSFTNMELIYGATESLSLTLKAPVFNKDSKFSNLNLRTKYRFKKKDKLGKQISSSFIFGAKFNKSSNQDFLFAFATGKEGLKNYYFADVRYLLRESQNDIFFYDVAAGIRYGTPTYYQPDLVLLLEINGEVKKQSSNKMFISPTFLFSYRNNMLKGGIKIPLNNSNEKKYVLGLENHF